MTDSVRILAVAGSLRAGSTNRRLLRAAQEEAPDGIELVPWDGLRDLPAFDEDAEATAPAAVIALRAALADADAMLVSTPEYNGSVPGALKNAVDWVSRPPGASALAGKPVAVVGASASPFGAVWAQAELRKVLVIAGARVLEQGASLGKAAMRLDADGRLAADDPVRAELAAVLEALRDAARERDDLAVAV